MSGLDLLALGVDMLGGVMGMSAADKNRRQAQRQFDQQMDHSVRRRVEDAKRSGVHPLFALGASAGASPTITAQGERNPAQSALSAMAETLNSLETNKAQARKDEAEAMLFDSERKRIEQDLNSRSQDAEALTEIDKSIIPAKRGTVMGVADYYRPQVAQSQTTGVEAGTHPTRIEVVDPAGNEYTLPAPNIGMDEIGQIEYVMGVPARMYNNIKRHILSQREQKEMEEELRRLRAIRNNPDKVREYKALVQRAKAKAAKVVAWINRHRRW